MLIGELTGYYRMDLEGGINGEPGILTLKITEKMTNESILFPFHLIMSMKAQCDSLGYMMKVLFVKDDMVEVIHQMSWPLP